MPLQNTFAVTAPELGDTTERLLGKLLAVSNGSPLSGTALTSAARTANTTSSTISAQGRTKALAYLNVSALTGAPSLTVRLYSIDPVSGTASIVATGTIAVTAVGCQTIGIGPGSGSGNGATWGTPQFGVHLPPNFRLMVIHGTADSVTYSLSYHLL